MKVDQVLTKDNVIQKLVFESGVPLGKRRSPISIRLCRLFSVRQLNHLARIHTVLYEIGSFPSRIAAVVRATSQEGDLWGLPVIGSNGLLAPQEHVRTQDNLRPGRDSGQRMIGWLDYRLYSQAFDDGARWALRRTSTESQTEYLPKCQQIALGDFIRQESPGSNPGEGVITCHPVKWIYKITFPNGKIYVGMDLTGTFRYFGSWASAAVAAEFTEEQRRDFTIRREILWESEIASDAEVRQKEIEFITALKSADPAIGYNRPRRLRPEDRQ
jgi:hypothetical protein